MSFLTTISFEILEEEAKKAPLTYSIADLALLAEENNPDGLFMEFGVYKGGTINRIARALPHKTIYGFDSFKGLPETWILNDQYMIGRQVFDVKGELPEVVENIILVPGMFKNSLPSFVKDDHKVSFLHMDCDLYSSTVDVFNFYEDKLLDNCILAFDDIGCGFGYEWADGYVNWREGQAKAFIEMINRQQYEWKPLCRDAGDNNRFAFQIRRRK